MTDLSLKQRWWNWHKANPHIWELFERFTEEAIGRGATRLSGWLIVNRIRWQTSVVTRGRDFKISNDFVALYVRLWQVRHPARASIFNTKTAPRLGERKEAT